MMLAIRQCPPGETSMLLADYWELVDGRLGGTTALLYACYLGRTDVAEAIAHRRRAISVHEAAALDDVERLTAILDNDPNAANLVTSDGFHPLGLACFFGREAAAALLIARGAEVATPSANASRVAPLHSAVAARHAGIAKLLIERGAPVDARQQGGFTPLMSAAHRADMPIIELLLAHGADPALIDDTGSSAGDHARTSGHAELAAMLAARAAGGGDAGQDHAAAQDLQPAERLAEQQPGETGGDHGLEQQADGGVGGGEVGESPADQGLAGNLADERESEQGRPAPKRRRPEGLPGDEGGGE
jgi:adenosylhomocysteine nucleosidase